MLILKLAYDDDLSFSKDLQELRERLKKKDILIGLVESIEGKTHIIKIICEENCYNEKIKEIINMYVSNILYRIVIENYRKKEMFEFLTDNYFFLKQNEILEIENEIMKVLKCEDLNDKEGSVYCLNRINSIINKIQECISENQEINVDGFLTFRMRKLRKEIEEVIEKVIEIYMVEKEYNEFVKLLKYFVNIQECKIEEVNIIINEDNKYKVEDKEGRDLYKDFLKELTGDEKDLEVNIEDILISGLITSSPENIVIHGKENCNNKEFLETIENVFGNKVRYCDKIDECIEIKNMSKNVDIYK
ncbi:putative sporulation protein YtxC [Clostridium neonatale]|uniref:Sporulation protein n=1 Tax=Clostridium neonatale TaxID=137838 RepID=A0AAD1YH27_9CLOT|nr:putative sporulation protein YtxC [Clostridium neonatale]CAI3203926.1 putative sporulation protein [Clostridium neonatale]CAI3208959.1 putative sporulation protein [Clostridium neonatale]CAI3239198.1 putative sporulation protein [Clostridium neonatale]CAI3243226.1 putative sporulation protein [Clostridium neonatale]CAI3539925.1 putative sporulation protein [Clostridium neonatale]